MISINDQWMRRAAGLARRGKGRTAPNPAVGCVIVKRGRVIGEGWHRKAGGPHAEIAALRSCKTPPEGAAMYVTLEPCAHHGRTPPCADAIIKAGVGVVVIGIRDHSPKQGRRGAEVLRRAGVDVRTGVLKEDCGRLVEDFLKHAATGLPFVTLKAAVTLDGKIATRTGDSKWISSEKSRRMVHRMRNESDAVMVGADTVIADDPALTVRHGRPRKNPLRVIVDGRLRTPPASRIVTAAKDIPTLIATTPMAPDRQAARLLKAGVDVITIAGRARRVDLRRLMKELGKRDTMSVLLESGGALAGAMINAGLVDRAMFFIAPKIAGGPRAAMAARGVLKMADAWRLDGVVVSRCGPDVVIEGIIAEKR